MLKWFAFDSKFKPGIYDKTFKECAESGMTALCAIVEDGELCFHSKEKCGMENQDFFRYLQLMDYFEKEKKNDRAFFHTTYDYPCDSKCI